MRACDICLGVENTRTATILDDDTKGEHLVAQADLCAACIAAVVSHGLVRAVALRLPRKRLAALRQQP